MYKGRKCTGRSAKAGRRQGDTVQLEHDILKKANELLKKDLGVDLQLLSNREKTTLVDALREEYGLTERLEQLDLARSSYFYHRSPMRVADKYAEIRRKRPAAPSTSLVKTQS